jgi:hypothetical protein
MISIGQGDFEKISRLLFVASLLDPRYKMDVLKYWLMSNVMVEKAKKIISKLNNVLDQLYNHYAKNV